MSPSRIDELRRRVQNDPASIAFAQLAEEYRRAGEADEAVRVCRDGLTRHPGYLSARVTLGRALLDLGELGEARGEFEFVIAEAPENLAAVRGLAEISHREGQTADALTYYQRALALSRHDPEVEEIVQQLSRQVGASSAPSNGLSFEEAHMELLSAAERVPLAPPAATPPTVGPEGSTAPFDFDRLVAALGTPTAPAQFEAAVTGHAAVAPIDLPEPVNVGPNPFAALEEELRAHDPVPVDRPRPWEAVPAADPALDVPTWDVTDLASTPPEASPLEPAPDAESAAEAAPAGSLSPEDVLADTMLGDAVELLDAAAVGTDEPSPIDALLAAPVVQAEPRGAAALPVDDAFGAPPAAAPAIDLEAAAPAPSADADVPGDQPKAPARQGDDVLGDLESWLNTLHDRSGD